MLLSYIAGTISVFVWALLPIVVKSSFAELPISSFLVLRFTFATLFLAGLFFRFRRELFKIQWHTYLLFIVILGANYWLQSLAIKDLPVSWYIVIFALNPLLALIFMRIRWTRSLLLSCLLALAGVFCFLFKEEKILEGLPLMSFIYLLGGMFTWVLYTIVASSHQKLISDSTLTLLTQFCSWVGVLILWRVDGGPEIHFFNLSVISQGAILLSGIGVPIAYYLYLYSLRRTPLFSQMSQYLELLFGLAFSWFIYQEDFHWFKLAGSALILLSLFVISIKVEKNHSLKSGTQNY